MKADILDLVDTLDQRLLTSGLTIATAESVTSGYLQYLLSLGNHTTDYYQGGITVYNNEQKCEQLGISYEISKDNLAVNTNVAELLAMGAANLFKTDIGLGITGFAKAVPQMGVHSVYAFLAIASKETIIFRKLILAHFDNQHANQKEFARKSLHYLVESLQTINKAYRYEELFSKKPPQ